MKTKNAIHVELKIPHIQENVKAPQLQPPSRSGNAAALPWPELFTPAISVLEGEVVPVFTALEIGCCADPVDAAATAACGAAVAGFAASSER
jgi:hypothetical protein